MTKNLKPKYLVLPVTYRCNAQCVMCNLGRGHAEEISLELVKKMVSEPDVLSELGLINITGGEPFLHESLDHICFELAENIPSLSWIGFSSNGLLGNKIRSAMQNLVENLPNQNLKVSIELSLDGPPEVHDKVRGVKGAFDKVIQTFHLLKDLQKSNPRFSGIGFGCNVNRHTVNHLAETHQIAKELNANITFTPAIKSDIFFQNTETSDAMDLTQEDIKKGVAFYDSLLEQGALDSFYHKFATNFLLRGIRTTGCVFRRKGFFLAPDGKIFICQTDHSLYLGSLTESELSDILLNENSRQLRESMLDLCRRCGSNCMLYDAQTRGESVQTLINRVFHKIKQKK